jgi:hypothetical protein
MNNERSARIVQWRRPIRVPPETRETSLTGAVAVVLSTYRSDSVDMVLDHPLWLACMETVGDLVRAESVIVHVEPEPGFLDDLRARLFGERTGPALGSPQVFVDRSLADDSTPDWQYVYWRTKGRLVAAAACEPWYKLGGPERYHDSYTSCIFVEPALVPELARALQLRLEREGAWIEEVVDESA